MITEDRQTQLDAALKPSAEFVREYDSQAMKYRVTAWVTLGAAAALIGTGIGLTVAGRGQAATLNDQVDAYNAATIRTTAEFDLIKQRENDLVVLDSLSITTFLLGAAAATAGGLLWFMGPEPGRYDTFLGVGEAQAVDVSVILGPGGILGRVRF